MVVVWDEGYQHSIIIYYLISNLVFCQCPHLYGNSHPRLHPETQKKNYLDPRTFSLLLGARYVTESLLSDVN